MKDILMQAQDIAVILGEIPDLAGLEPDELRVLAKHCTLEAREEQAVLYKEDVRSNDFFYLVSGLVESRVRIPSREAEESLRTHKPGRVFGETALLDGGRRGTTTVARERSLLLRFNGSTLPSLCDSDTKVALAVYRWLARVAAEHGRENVIELRNALGNF